MRRNPGRAGASGRLSAPRAMPTWGQRTQGPPAARHGGATVPGSRYRTHRFLPWDLACARGTCSLAGGGGRASAVRSPDGNRKRDRPCGAVGRAPLPASLQGKERRGLAEGLAGAGEGPGAPHAELTKKGTSPAALSRRSASCRAAARMANWPSEGMALNWTPPMSAALSTEQWACGRAQREALRAPAPPAGSPERPALSPRPRTALPPRHWPAWGPSRTGSPRSSRAWRAPLPPARALGRCPPRAAPWGEPRNPQVLFRGGLRAAPAGRGRAGRAARCRAPQHILLTPPGGRVRHRGAPPARRGPPRGQTRRAAH